MTAIVTGRGWTGRRPEEWEREAPRFPSGSEQGPVPAHLLPSTPPPRRRSEEKPSARLEAKQAPAPIPPPLPAVPEPSPPRVVKERRRAVRIHPDDERVREALAGLNVRGIHRYMARNGLICPRFAATPKQGEVRSVARELLVKALYALGECPGGEGEAREEYCGLMVRMNRTEVEITFAGRQWPAGLSRGEGVRSHMRTLTAEQRRAWTAPAVEGVRRMSPEERRRIAKIGNRALQAQPEEVQRARFARVSATMKRRAQNEEIRQQLRDRARAAMQKLSPAARTARARKAWQSRMAGQQAKGR